MADRRLLLAEELLLLSMRPPHGRPPIGTGAALNASLAGLLVAELELPDRPLGSVPLEAAGRVRAERGPRLTAVLSHMDRGLRRHTGMGTRDLLSAGLADIEPAVRDEIVGRLRAAAAGSPDGPPEMRTVLLLSFTGPAKLLGIVHPQWRGRWRTRRRIDHLLDGSPNEAIRDGVRRVITQDEAALAIVATSAVVAAG